MLMKLSDCAGLFGNTVHSALAVLQPFVTARDSDSESHRRKTMAVRGVQLAMVAMVAVAIAGALLIGAHKLSALRRAALVLAGVA
ncbi:MAG TPA: hypothetical protein VHP11_17350, partial [Tepidisphaeraceae bacterium]|nr:hypothetical protein [Tepidisphaeraceae bacterium]